MPYHEIDMALASEFAWPILLILGLLAYLFLRDIVIRVHRLWTSVRTRRRVVRMRSNGKRAGGAVARQTDQFAQLSPKAKRIHKIAEQLFQQRKFREAALLFESINFQRRAIDILEQNGFVEDAAEILVKMGVPYRAAVLFERNGDLEKAAFLYQKSGHHREAGIVYVRLAERHYHYYRAAAHCFIEAEMIEEALRASSQLLLTEDILRLSFEHHIYEPLYDYLLIPYNVMAVLPQLTDQQVRDMLAGVALTPRLAQTLAMWLQYRPDPLFLTVCLEKIRSQPETTRVFWSHLSPTFTTQICHILAAQPQLLTGPDYRLHGEILRDVGKVQHGDYFLQMEPYGRVEGPNTGVAHPAGEAPRPEEMAS